MKKKDWLLFKVESEAFFKTVTVDTDSIYGFQIQSGTQWQAGLSENDIKKLENHFGCQFPDDYVDMLKAFNGFHTRHISISPESGETTFQRRCYHYPDDLENVQWLIDEVHLNINYAKLALAEIGIDTNQATNQIEGFIPLYAHRALVVLKDKSKSPVLSIWGDDIIVYGETLIDYWHHEFGMKTAE